MSTEPLSGGVPDAHVGDETGSIEWPTGPVLDRAAIFVYEGARMQPAVAVRRDPDGGPPYPVCRHHTHLRRGDLVPLSILLGGNDGSTTSGSVSPALPETGE